MKKTILKKIQIAQAQAEFNVEIVPRRRGKMHPDHIRRTHRDETGNHINAEGELVLSHILTDMGKTMTPSEQYRKSHLRKVVKDN